VSVTTFIRVFATALLLPLLATTAGCQGRPAALANPVFALTGYLPDYRIRQADPEQLARYYSDIILFSVEPTAAGGIDSRRLGDAAYATAGRLKLAGVRHVLVTVGGGNRSSRFAEMANHPAARRKLISGLALFCQQHGFDGVDYDWEAPVSQFQEASYSALITETKTAFQPRGLLVTAAVASWQNLSPDALGAIDRVHLMAYDGPGEHSTYEFATAAAEKWLAKGLEPHKLSLGVPFYARGIVRHGRARTYADIAARCRPGPETDCVNDYYFNGAVTLARKQQYARERGLGGVMVWEVGQDTADCELARALAAGLPGRP
jgi:hypothetical protein